MSDREIITELERLAICFPRADMDARKWQVLFLTYADDLSRFSIGEIREGCQRYRTSPGVRFFPSPGELIEACKNPYADKPGRRYDPIEDLPEAKPPDQVEPIIAKARAKYPGVFGSNGERISCEDRQPLVMTPELVRRESELGEIRAKNLATRLKSKPW